ncbi:hypothetical protein SPHINGOAX6_70950 [Sphingomonas sp. AX6]|nr:hypothetical protein SPHINGOAX6_70950 [Sphingomonas sp. AX6]
MFRDANDRVDGLENGRWLSQAYVMRGANCRNLSQGKKGDASVLLRKRERWQYGGRLPARLLSQEYD